MERQQIVLTALGSRLLERGRSSCACPSYQIAKTTSGQISRRVTWATLPSSPETVDIKA
jgi:hypothetical protein